MDSSVAVLVLQLKVCSRPEEKSQHLQVAILTGGLEGCVTCEDSIDTAVRPGDQLRSPVGGGEGGEDSEPAPVSEEIRWPLQNSRVSYLRSNRRAGILPVGQLELPDN